jgi:acetolactate synthase-1/2/3 large subunit
MTTILPSRGTETPVGVTDSAGHPQWGSDLILDMLRLFGIEYAAVLPGSSFRGIHDSAINYTANARPQMLLCNHEMICVGLARGYYRATGKPMAAMLHNFVGLLNSAMTIYDAWCDRSPVLVIGGTGPMDATLRRPWIDWIHTANLQADPIRNFVKWDDQPWSVASIPESMMRGYRIAVSEPCGPVYLCFNTDDQEAPITDSFPLPDVGRFAPAPTPRPDPAAVQEAARLLVNAELPLALADRVGRSAEAVRALVELAELLAMPVLNLGSSQAFPTLHPMAFAGMNRELLREADVVLGLDCVDLAGASLISPPGHGARNRLETPNTGKKVINVSMDELITRSMSTDYQALPAADVPMLSTPSVVLPLLLEAVRSALDSGARARIDRRRQVLEGRQQELQQRFRRVRDEQWDRPEISELRLWAELWEAIKNEDYCITHGAPGRSAPGILDIPGPERSVAGGGGGAVGSGPSVALGAGLGLRESGKLPVGFFGDGDFLSGGQAVWTAAHYGIPGVWVLKNNRSYYNDEDHQLQMAHMRERPVENKWIGMRMENPEVNFAGYARDLGAGGEGPIHDAAELPGALKRAVQRAKEGELVVVDVRVENRDQG